MIEAKIVKGFRDFLPIDEAIRQEKMAKLKDVFLQYQYQAIDTPILEYSETLLGKSGGETEKQIFRFTDNGGRDVALRFDLTVPFARYLAMHKDELGVPFRRYHMAKVWRGEKPQKGRYREFIQCDFDIVGDDSLQSDLDILLTVHSSFKALGMDKFVIHINHRGLLNQFFTENNLIEHSNKIMHEIDKLDKVGLDATKDQLSTFLTENQISIVLSFIKKESCFKDTLNRVEKTLNSSSYIDRIKNLYSVLEHLGIASYFEFNLAITRGLDYYTGLVFETFLMDLPSIGSVCSGGRYDNLLGLYSKDSISGIGGSIGLDRLMAAMQELGLYDQSDRLDKTALIIYSDDKFTENNFLATKLREMNFMVQIYPSSKKFDAQLKFALRHKLHYLVFFEDNQLKLKNLWHNQVENFIDINSFLDYIGKL